MPRKITTAEDADSIMKPVTSSTVARIGYVETTSTLIVEFKSGGTYIHDNFPLDLHDQFMQSDSHGKFYAKHIKGKFETTKLPNPALGENKNPAFAVAVL